MSEEFERAKVANPWLDLNICGGAGIHGQLGMKCSYDEHGTFWCGCLDFPRKGNSEAYWLLVCVIKEQKVHLAPHGQGIKQWAAFCKYLAETHHYFRFYKKMDDKYAFPPSALLGADIDAAERPEYQQFSKRFSLSGGAKEKILESDPLYKKILYHHYFKPTLFWVAWMLTGTIYYSRAMYLHPAKGFYMADWYAKALQEERCQHEERYQRVLAWVKFNEGVFQLVAMYLCLISVLIVFSAVVPTAAVAMANIAAMVLPVGDPKEAERAINAKVTLMELNMMRNVDLDDGDGINDSFKVLDVDGDGGLSHAEILEMGTWEIVQHGELELGKTRRAHLVAATVVSFSQKLQAAQKRTKAKANADADFQEPNSALL
ncbi:hypothetical protein B484DRAFT_396835 [Ochromonadaceae sp. CCMP2298]|nr:hypothetical protein B484DRAFT_396835 [Ochromonadaceae sp. CCMP2298]